MWQDFVIAIAQWVFVASLLPTVFHKHHKPSFSTSLITALGMLVVTITQITIPWWMAASSAATLTVLWSILAFQRWKLNKRL